MSEKICTACEHYVDCAYFCISRNRFIFPDDMEGVENCNKWETRTEKNINLNKKKRKF
jgi:hypothetical protein